MWLDLYTFLQSLCDCIMYYFFFQVRSVALAGFWWSSWNVNQSAVHWAKGTKLTVLPCSQKKRMPADITMNGVTQEYWHAVLTQFSMSVLQHANAAWQDVTLQTWQHMGISLCHFPFPFSYRSIPPQMYPYLSHSSLKWLRNACFWVSAAFSPPSTPPNFF